MSAAGTWDTTMNTPMGAQKGTLTLEVDGDTLTGKLSGPQGDIELEEGTVAGNDLTWKASMTSPMPMTLEFSAAVDGDAISGTVKLGSFGDADFAGTRV